MRTGQVKAALLLATLAVGGCAAAATSNIRTAASGAAEAEEWVVHGRQNPIGKLKISINAEPVIEGTISIWTGDGEFAGAFRGHRITATCARGEGQVRTRCALFRDGAKLTTLLFKVL